jgi:hypothetical protein
MNFLKCTVVGNLLWKREVLVQKTNLKGSLQYKVRLIRIDTDQDLL